MVESTWKLSSPSPVLCPHTSTVLYCTALYCTVLYCTCTPTPASSCPMDRWCRCTHPAEVRCHLPSHPLHHCHRGLQGDGGEVVVGGAGGVGHHPGRVVELDVGAGVRRQVLACTGWWALHRREDITGLSPGSRSRAAGLDKRIPPVQTWSR